MLEQIIGLAMTSALSKAHRMNDDLLAELERLRDAVREHQAQVIMGARDEYDLNEADEALWRVLGGSLVEGAA